MNRYILSESEHPLSSDYYYEAAHTINPKTIFVKSHSHNYYEIYIYISGAVKILLNNHIFNVQKGDVVIIPPHSIHSLIPISLDIPYDRMYLYATETCLSSFQFKEYSLLKPLLDTVKIGKFHYHIDSLEDFQRITYAIEGITESKKTDLYGKEMMNRSYILQLFTTINSYIAKETIEKPIGEITSLISRVIAYINENFEDSITLKSLCELFFTNRQTLTKLFKEYTNLTIHNYITMVRIEQAKQLIYKGIQPSRIHLMCGFNDYTTFYRAFKKTEGITPQQFVVLSQNGGVSQIQNSL
jgi:AraC-like DNA-binding protein